LAEGGEEAWPRPGIDPEIDQDSAVDDASDDGNLHGRLLGDGPSSLYPILWYGCVMVMFGHHVGAGKVVGLGDFST